jgi:hypothetical protein
MAHRMTPLTPAHALAGAADVDDARATTRAASNAPK